MLLVPYNLMSLGEKIVGADARFWFSLEKNFRRILLLKPPETLDELSFVSIPSCTLKKLIEGPEQADNLRTIKNDLLQNTLKKNENKRNMKRNPLRLLGLRLASLLIPGNTIYKKLEDEVYDSDLRELRVAALLIKRLNLELARPISKTLYLKLEASVEGNNKEIIINDKVYSKIFKIDSVFREDLKAEILNCLNINNFTNLK